MYMVIHQKSQAWREYQDKAAELFRKMGFHAAVEDVLEGARGKHKVDVVARTILGGVTIMWIVECKYWKSNVPKAHVLTLAQIAQDTGADRAVLLSEKGFQPGAVSVSSKSNILLTSLGELESAAEDSIANLSIKKSLDNVKEIENELRKIMPDYNTFCVPSSVPPELDQAITLAGACLEVMLAVVAAQTGRFPVRLPSMFSDEPRWADELPRIAEALALDVEEIAARYKVLKPEIGRVLKPYVEASGELIRLVRNLMTAGTELLPPLKELDDETPKLQTVLAAMRAVGGCAETLRSTPSGTLSDAVQGLMRNLINGAYLWFADPDRTHETWDELTIRTDQDLVHLADVAEKMLA